MVTIGRKPFNLFKKGPNMNGFQNMKPTFQFLEGAFYMLGSTVMYIATFLKDFMANKSLIIQIPVSIFILAGALYYIARFRQVWIEGSNSINKKGKKNG